MSALRSLFSPCKLCFRVSDRFLVGQISSRYCTSATSSPEQDVAHGEKKLSKAMKAYLERSRKYNEFMRKEEEAYNIGKRHLANMMGADPETFTQENIDEAIKYLFPSGLHEKAARPFMKPPHLVFPPKKDAEFDETGRPFHYLFYTGKPNFYNVLHECVENLNKINELEDKSLRGKISNVALAPLDLEGYDVLSIDEMQQKLVEEISDQEYANFIQVIDRLKSHKNASVIKEFILQFQKLLMKGSMTFAPTEPEIGPDGRRFVLTKDAPRKTARADVKVIHPGTGLITINGLGIEYFTRVESRSQILFPLELTGMRDSIDVEATVTGGGTTTQAGAIRWGISWGLRCFVSPEIFETMRLAGLLTRDFRRKERKKPGQEGARRKYTWKKR